LEDDIVEDVHMEMLEKSIDLWKRSNSHRYIKILYYYIISEHRKKEFLLYIELFPVWLPLVMQQNTSLILLYFCCFPLEALETRAHVHEAQTHTHTHTERERERERER
jgi:hypothetical protein